MALKTNENTSLPTRLSRGTDRKMIQLRDEIDRQREAGLLDPAELHRLVSDVQREAAEPVFLQMEKRKHGIIPAGTPLQPTGYVMG